jgi:Na+/phosphate symporter
VKIEEPVKLHYLEPHLLNTPSIALEQSVNSIRYMVKEAWKMVEMATNKSFMKGKTEIEMTSHLARREEKIDKLQQDITDYLVELTRRKLTEPQSSIIPLLMHCTNDAEKIADHTENILSLSKRLEEAKHKISKSAKEELRELWGNLSAEAENVMRALNRTDKDNIDLALYEEEKINRAVDELEKRHIKRLQKGECNPVVGIIFIEMLSELEKIGDHLSNIAERTPEMQRHHINLRYRENI